MDELDRRLDAAIAAAAREKGKHLQPELALPAGTRTRAVPSAFANLWVVTPPALAADLQTVQEEVERGAGDVRRTVAAKLGDRAPSVIDLHRRLSERSNTEFERHDLPLRFVAPAAPAVKRHRPTLDEARAEAMRLSGEMRIDFAAIEGNQAGARVDVSTSSAEIARARGVIANRLRGMNTTLATIGRVLGVTHGRVSQILDEFWAHELARIDAAYAALEKGEGVG